MKPKKRIIIHVGTHKTGTTSIQSFLYRVKNTLRQRYYDYYKGLYIPFNHVELHLVSMRLKRMSPYKEKLISQGISINSQYKQVISRHINNYVNQSNYDCIIFSAEGLSYLLYKDEVLQLKKIFEGCQAVKIEILMYVRNPDDFLTSYSNELRKHFIPNNVEKDSYAYIEKDTWLVDYSRRIELFRSVFSTSQVEIIDYDDMMGRDGNIIPSFLDYLGLGDTISDYDFEQYWYNPSK